MRQVLLALALGAAAASASAAPPGWEDYTNSRFGYRLAWPASEGFTAEPPTTNGDGQTFSDGRARIVIYGAENSDNFTPVEYRKTLLQEFPNYNERTYDPRGKTWFVLSGFKSDLIYYQKVMFSCGERRISVLSVTFPAAEKPRYAPIVERLEDGFRPAACN